MSSLLDNKYPVNTKALLIAGVITIALLAIWEITVRKMGYWPWMENDKHIWAQQRAKCERATKDDIVIIGSSRVYFDLQLDAWEAETGRKPIQLAIEGSSPLPILKDIVETSRFAGTLIVGVTPGLFYSPPSNEYNTWNHPSTYAEHYHKRTYAERTGHLLSIPLQSTLAFLFQDASHYNSLDLKSILKWPFLSRQQRVETHPPFPVFASLDRDRNMRMLPRTATDTAHANMVKRVWGFYGRNIPPPEAILKMKPVISGMVVGLITQFKARGGQVIFVRCPSAGPFLDGENNRLPRGPFWDELLEATQCPGYHFEDYEFMNKYTLPEWSHLSGPDADAFTRDLVRQMKQDGLL